MSKGFKEMTFEELVDMIRGELVIALGKGTFKNDVFFWCELVVRWKSAQDKKNRPATGTEKETNKP
jgi:hypothetical protein